jgi:membrane-associated protease RseP (regulator of RpoE activity)
MRRIPWLALILAAGCGSMLPEKLPDKPPPLAGMEEPLALFVEPDDEPARQELPRGSFTDIVVGSGWSSLDEEGDEPGLPVKRIVENSPADAAGIAEGDILLAVIDAQGEETELRWPSQWRKLELETEPGAQLTIVHDRAGVEREVAITVIPRVRHPERQETERFREEDRVGVVLRTATEVEAREVGLGPGGGAVVVGLSRDSPWRAAGLVYEDLITAVDGKSVDHPQVVLDAIREGEGSLKIAFVRDGRDDELSAPLSRRVSEVTRFNIVIVDYESDRGRSELSILFGLFLYESTPAAWEWRLLWIFRARGGDADRLEEVEEETP